MTGDMRLIDTNVLVHAYTVSDQRKHEVALSLVEKVWEGEAAATTLQNLCELFSVIMWGLGPGITILSILKSGRRLSTNAPRWRLVVR
jgi:predicted nucleic acid-binding protein